MQLFISYNSIDRISVIAVQKLLQARGINTFLDHDNLVSGLAWPQALEQTLRAVDGVAVFIGHELGGWQKRELWFALDRQVREEKEGRTFPVIPVLLQGADLTPGFLFLNTWIDLRRGLDGLFTAEALNAFERAIKATEPVRYADDSAAWMTERAEICPYRGLQIFREEDAAFFVGRKAFAEHLFDFTLGKNLVVVVGSSGSGKSSVVQAGLLPLLRREQPPANTWDAVSFTPGNDPFQRLASALIPLLEPELSETARLAEAEELGRNLAAGRTRVEAVINRVIERSNGTGRLLLVADQFEELFTQTPELDRRPFVQALLHARGSAAVSVLVTLRADFYSQIITLDRELSDIAPVQVNIGALTPDELRESITLPARLVGLEFESGLVDRILTDVGSEPGRLPLVQFALTEIWQRREERRLTNRAYDEIGGVTGALARRAEAEFTRLNPEEQTGARYLFSRLVRVAGPEGPGEDTRQRIQLSGADTLAKRVAKRLADARLLVTDSEAATGTISVEVAHEVLIRDWERLRGWLNENREFLLWRQRLSALLAVWKKAQESDEAVLRGPLLDEAQKWFNQPGQDLSDEERKFIAGSLEERERLVRKEKEQQARELEAAQKLTRTEAARAEEAEKRAKEQKEAARKLRRRALAAAGAAGTALILLVIAAVMWRKSESAGAEAVRQAQIATAQSTAAKEQAQIANEQRLAAQSARAEAEEQALAAQHALTDSFFRTIGISNGDVPPTTDDREALWELAQLAPANVAVRDNLLKRWIGTIEAFLRGDGQGFRAATGLNLEYHRLVVSGAMELGRSVAADLENPQETNSDRISSLGSALAAVVDKMEPQAAAEITKRGALRVVEALENPQETNSERLSSLGTAVAALADNMEPQVAAKIASQGAQRLAAALEHGQKRATERLSSLGTAVAALANKMEPQAAAKIATGIAAALENPPKKISKLQPTLLPSLSNALESLAAKMEPQAAAKIAQELAAALENPQETDSQLLSSLGRTLAAFCTLLPSAHHAHLLALSNLLLTPLSEKADNEDKGQADDRKLLTAVCAQLRPQDLAEVLKYPFCTGDAEQIILNAISPNFSGTLWKFVEQADALDIKDIGSPAQRPSAQDAIKELEGLQMR
jgi:hypothetical protein